ncbi:hypothetical protein HGRIS_006726 [Hohenbuehelia grisea]|uniref:T6SS Phospholipase effector Tle1-like catalytic domain-containing protein n=1 Tax=Hohenbuehelia grisea TaxID=104357 RepID=A0ABR3J9U3_9AGAR
MSQNSSPTYTATPTFSEASTIPETPEMLPDPSADEEPKGSTFNCQHKYSTLNLVCLDGTANQFGEKNTNVVELYSRLEKSPEQLTYYDSGIGTYAKPSYASFRYWKQMLNHTVDMAIAWNFERIVLSAYEWLSENYQDGAQIFIFGFSRGAYQARVIAGMIEKVGLLHKGNTNQIAFAYELYTATTESSARESHDEKEKKRAKRKSFENAKAERLCRRFKETLSRRDVKVHFIGAWDTVSSVGIIRQPSLPETTAGMKHVCAFRHALALDERRVKFLPEYADGGAGPCGEGDVKEVWFAGSHSDIGGGNVANMDLDKFGPALRWMTYEAIGYGLKTVPYTHKWATMHPIESLTPIWKVVECLPLRHLSYKGKEGKTKRPHLGGSRIVQEGQQIHASVFESIGKEAYIPAARIHDRKRWQDAHIWREEVIELDPYTSANAFLSGHMESQSIELSDAHTDALVVIIQKAHGLRSIVEFPGSLDALFAALEVECSKSGPISESQQIKINALVTALAAFPPQPQDSRKYSYLQLRHLVSMMSPLKVHTLKQIQHNLGFPGHPRAVWCISVSPDSKHIASGSRDATIRVWDINTGGDVIAPFKGHRGLVKSIQYSPNGEHIVSYGGGPDDGTIRVWDAQTGEQVIRPIAVEEAPGPRHRDWLGGIGVAPDGSKIVCGSSNKTVQVWDARTGEEVMESLKGHERPISSVVVSPDGSLIASGSYDHTIRIWDATTGDLVVEPLTGHTDWVFTVAFSPDSRHVVSGSKDKTIRVWNVQTGGEEMKLEGHTDWVWSVAVSPDGSRIVSGSEDRTIRIWDAQTGQEVMQPLRGHVAAALCIAITPDGTRVVSGSGSSDKSIRVWDLKSGQQLIGPQQPS